MNTYTPVNNRLGLCRRTAFRNEQVHGATRHAILPVSRHHVNPLDYLHCGRVDQEGMKVFSFKSGDDLEAFLKANPDAEEIRS